MRLAKRKMLWLWTLMLGPLAGSSAEGKSPTEVIGILGESATFLLESPSPFDLVLWFRNETQVAALRPEPPLCQLKQFGAYDSRDVTTSQDCRSLTVRGLLREDCAGYRAQILRDDQIVAIQTFSLKVYRSSGDGKLPEEVLGILGKSATFQLERPFEQAFWSQNGTLVANLILGPPCQVQLSGALVGREVTVSQDCRSFTLRGLCKEDSAEYTAQILDSAGVIARETFHLKVYRYSADRKSAKEVVGILGESATFRLESPQAFDLIFWYQNEAGLAALRPEPAPCQFTLDRAYRSRMITVSPDCRSLTIRGLHEEDSVSFRAWMMNSDEIVAEQIFTLKVYRSPTEGRSPKQMLGILGESVTFPLENPRPFNLVYWYRNEMQVAILRQGPQCQLRLLGAYDSRNVSVSQDCSSLTIRDVRQEDSAQYKAHLHRIFVMVGSQAFLLKVYKHLSEADLEVVCVKHIRRGGNETLLLNCSAGKWEDGVEFLWTSPKKTGVFSKTSLLLLYRLQGDDREVTCMAENPISSASRTVSLDQACVGPSVKEKPPKEVIGTLGESATFPLESPSLFAKVQWFRNKMLMASLRPEPPPCQLLLYGSYSSRDVTISQDCSTLTVHGLHEADSAGYRAQMLNSAGGVVARQTFTLRVYKHLSEADLEVACAEDILSDGNETLQLSCSAGNWEDGVQFSWTSSGHSGQVSSSGNSLVFLDKPQDDDGNFTCMAENPTGRASRTVSLKEACAGNVDNPSGLPGATIGVMITMLIMAKVIINVCIFAKWPTCTQERMIGQSQATFAQAQEEMALNRRDHEAPAVETPCL